MIHFDQHGNPIVTDCPDMPPVKSPFETKRTINTISNLIAWIMRELSVSDCRDITISQMWTVAEKLKRDANGDYSLPEFIIKYREMQNGKA